MKRVGIINCGMGNLHSVLNAFKRLDVESELIENASNVSQYDRIVLPGVGAFSSMMEKLTEQHFDREIERHIAAQKPFMGICLGMQVLFETSSEFGCNNGLSILKGLVEPLPRGNCSVPNVGWWELRGDFPAFSTQLCEDDTFYFVHSYHCVPSCTHDAMHIHMNGKKIVAAIRKNNIFAYQFHPEKSQVSGQKLLRSFVELA